MATSEVDEPVPSGDESEINGGAAGAGEGDAVNTPDAAPVGVTPPGLEGVNMLNEFKKELSDLREDMKRKDKEIEELRRLIAENEKDKKDEDDDFEEVMEEDIAVVGGEQSACPAARPAADQRSTSGN